MSSRPDFVNHRMPGEAFRSYRARLRSVAKAVRLHLRGRMAHKATEPVIGPSVGVDPQFDEAVQRGDIVVTGRVTLPLPRLAWPHGPKVIAEGKPPVTYRLCRTKGVTFRKYPAGRDRREWREIEPALVV